MTEEDGLAQYVAREPLVLCDGEPPIAVIFRKGGANARPLLDDDYSSFRFYKAGIFNAPYLINKKGKYKGYPFRSFTYSGFIGGYSDHLPVYVHVIKEVE